MTDQLASAGLTPPKWALLGVLYDGGSVSMHELAELLGVSSAFVSRLVKELAAEEFVRTDIGLQDKRIKAAAITHQGRDHVKSIELRLRKNLREYTKEVTSEDLESYLKVLRIFASLQ